MKPVLTHFRQNSPTLVAAGASALFLVIVLFPNEDSTVTGTIFSFAMAVAVGMALLFPRSCIALYLVSIAGMWATHSMFGLAVFYGPFLVAIITARLSVKWSLPLLLVVTATGIFDPVSRHVDSDLPSAAIWVILSLTALLAGLYIQRIRRNEQRIKELQRQRQEDLARSLHDSVAATLTSLVVRIESLAITRAMEDEELSDQLTDIAELGRHAIEQTRSLLANLQTPEGLTGGAPMPSVEEAARAAAETLESHGFSVSLDISLSGSTLSAHHDTAFQHVIAEATTNIIKYADPHAPVTVSVGEDAEEVVVTIVNGVPVTKNRTTNSSKMGLANMRGHMQVVRGTITTRKDGSTWTLQAQAPRR